MKFSLSTVWLIIAAVINPLCCCLGVLYGGEPGGPAAVHDCCTPSSEQSGQENSTKQKQAAGDHASGECPHEQTKKSTMIFTSNDLAIDFTVLWGPLVGFVSIERNFKALSQSPLPEPLLLDTRNAPPGNHQWISVYLI